MNLNNKIFHSVLNTENSEVSEETIFKYFQDGKIIQAEYSNGSIIRGFLIGFVNENNTLEFSYQHINRENKIRVGECSSISKINTQGKIVFYETWKWTNGDCSSGTSVIEEV